MTPSPQRIWHRRPLQNFYKNMAPSPLTPSQSRWTCRVQVFKSGFPVCPPPYHNQEGGEARRWWLHNSRLASLGSASTGVASQVPGHPFYIRTVHFLDSNGPLYLTELVNCTKCCDMIVKGHYSAEHNFTWQSTTLEKAPWCSFILVGAPWRDHLAGTAGGEHSTTLSCIDMMHIYVVIMHQRTIDI